MPAPQDSPKAPSPERAPAEVLGLRLDRPSLAAALELLDAACRERRPLQVATVNLHFLTRARRDRAFREAVNGCGLSVADGRILMWVAALAGAPVPEQITGHDLVERGLALAVARGYRVFLLGGSARSNQAAVARLRQRFPALLVDGRGGDRFDEDGGCGTQDEVLARLRSFEPQLLFVALGAPKQERWLARSLAGLPPVVAVGVGGVVDTLAGELPRAPRWMQVAGLESLFQLLVEPRRYARRYLLEDPPTLLLALWEALGRRLGRRSRRPPPGGAPA